MQTEHRTTTNVMESPRHIMPAIDLLMASKKANRLPWWVKFLDYTMTALYLTAYAFGAYKLITWL